MKHYPNHKKPNQRYRQIILRCCIFNSETRLYATSIHSDSGDGRDLTQEEAGLRSRLCLVAQAESQLDGSDTVLAYDPVNPSSTPEKSGDDSSNGEPR